MSKDSGDLIADLHLEPHPEGGYYRRTYTGSQPVDTPAGQRPAATLIHFFLPAGDTSAWHLVTSDEIWLWHGPGVLRLQLGGSGDQPSHEETFLLTAPGEGGSQQVLVPAGIWQRTLPGDEDVLVSCMVSPGFSFDDFTLAESVTH